MADGLCTGDTVSNVIEKTFVKDYDTVIECMNNDRVNDVRCEKVKSFYISSDSDKLFDKLCVKGSKDDKHEVFTDVEMPCSPAEDDCRKKRCADRYDSSESSDSGVAVLSCTDCSGSSTASSDITDPGSPFSTASSHSEDSGSQPAKMPPTQSAHHPPWPWARGDSPPMKRHIPDKTAFPKRIKTENENVLKDDGTIVQKQEENKKPPICLSSTMTNITSSQVQNEIISNKSVPAEVLSTSNNNNNNNTKISSVMQNEKIINKKVIKKTEVQVAAKTQGKITEYFKAQMKANGIKKDMYNVAIKSNVAKNPNLHKYFSLVGGLKQHVTPKSQNQRKIDVRTVHTAVKKVAASAKSRKPSPVTVPRKILPAPSKVCDKVTVSSINDVNNFTPTVTLTTLTLPPNLAYLHTKTPKPPDNFIVQQFTTLGSDKINTIPIVSTTPCINTILHPLQKITTINNFNCIKLNATVVPIVKLNTLPSKVNGSNFGSVALNVESAVPTVIPAKPKVSECSIQTTFINATNLTPKQPSPSIKINVESVQNKHRVDDKSSSNSDSGISTKDQLEVLVTQSAAVESQKSPILSQPKTIRFPAKQQENSECKEARSSSGSDSSYCRWEECHAHFDTSGALLEHLQLKHVISQATQEQYVCLWLGCKVHGRTSCSRTWLERHVLAHAGTKPFRCIVEGCGMRFNSQLSLERHVNGHFNTDNSQNASTSKKSVENGSVKLFKRNGKKIRFRRQPWSARMFDFFDNGIMEGLQHQLLTMTDIRTLGQRESIPGDTMLLQSEVLARRIEHDGNRKVLLRWHPSNIVPDEWVLEKEHCVTKRVPIRRLQPNSVNELKPILFPQVRVYYSLIATDWERRHRTEWKQLFAEHGTTLHKGN
ncbi:hypothetical protein RN001_003151 [Aquatica leii]|uniref:C2H2-type domain-containing protein n=1 Tax=Aquatica leii TaxID=1421715 RepID=A0AAN7QBH3_9COLE|nr:hypothetical protein RN001_003151 [Aquatica leii]